MLRDRSANVLVREIVARTGCTAAGLPVGCTPRGRLLTGNVPTLAL